MNAPASILHLVERFDEQRPAYLAGKYNETQLRNDYLNPLFEALGWDVQNHKGRSEKYREVILEQSVEVAGQAKAADYAFRVGEKPMFFVEAKKPAVNIGANPEAGFSGAALRLVGQTFSEPFERFRAVGGVRLPHQARARRPGLAGTGEVVFV